MENTEQLSLSWVAHQKSICSGLSQLQQNGEFVDMTLAADGHHVKVHQIVLSLVSPYIKDLILTAQCPHPVIFLNNISYTTLCGILEYIYTGEVLVFQHRLSDLIAAGKALHIKGLRELAETQTADANTETNTSVPEKKETPKGKIKITHPKVDSSTAPAPTCKIYIDESNTIDEDSPIYMQDSIMETQDECTVIDETSQGATETLNNSNKGQSDKSFELSSEQTRKTLLNSKVQYALSNQGGLQTIFNRYLYQLRYVKKDGTRNWRCITYNRAGCRARILTNAKHEVIQRKFQHNHPFHDKNIINKLRIGTVFSKFKEAAEFKANFVKVNPSIGTTLHKLQDPRLLNRSRNLVEIVCQKLQYSVSIQGGLQVIHNRYIYNLRYFGKKNRRRLWRCVDYSSHLKCPATICTDENNQVTERSFTHNHGFHDNKIIKKLRNGIIYSVLNEAALIADGKKKERRVPCSVTDETSE